ncbi:MAG: TonB-dependent siderophore receptor [Azospirillaceae bacterium]|nr:TonB-dependent siderophore receptor [Azospirillaceae bacterium]
MRGMEQGRRYRLKATVSGLALLATAMLAAGTAGAQQTTQQAAPAPAAAGQQTFTIPAQDLNAALLTFTSRAGLQVFYDVSLVKGLRSTALNGSYTPAQGLAQLLAGTGLAYRFTGPTTVSLEPAPQGAAAPGVLHLGAVRVEGQGDDTAAQSAYGPGVGYVATRSAAGTKTDTPLIETPQAISVVTRQQMDDQNVQSVAQALRYTSGMVPEQRGNNTDSLEYLYARGFQIEEYLNGLRLPGVAVAGYNITSFDAYTLDRVEVLHGPASVLYGQSSPGGLLNLGTKLPTADPLHEIMLQTGSYGRAQGAVDLSGKLNDSGTLLGRLAADAFTTGTQTQHVDEQRIAIAPSLTWKPDADTTLTILGNYQRDPKAGLYNSVPAAGTVLPGVHIPRDFDGGEPGFDGFSKTEMSLGYSLSHTFDNTWSVQQNFRYLTNEQTVRYVGVDGVAAGTNGTMLAREAYYNHGTVENATLDNHAQAKFATGPLTHTATFGVDWQQTEFDHVFFGGSAPKLSITDPQYGQAIPPLTAVYATSTHMNLTQTGLYGQDQVRFDKWAFLIGVREDFTDATTLALKTNTTTKTDADAFTWRTGLVYLFDSGFAPYVSYSTSFQPSTGTTYAGSAFKPTTGQQYEVGVKYQRPGSNSFVILAAFNLTQQNVATTDPLHTSFQVQTGEIRSRGVELEAHASLTEELQAIATYTYTDLDVTKSNTTNLNKVPAGIPENMASGWLAFDMPWLWSQGMQLSGGVRYIGETWGDTTNTFQVPSVTLVDLGVRYDLGQAFPQMAALQGLSLSATASNLFDRTYVSGCIASSFCTYGAGRLVLGNVKYRW